MRVCVFQRGSGVEVGLLRHICGIVPHGDISPQNADLGPVSSPLGLFVFDQPRGLRSL